MATISRASGSRTTSCDGGRSAGADQQRPAATPAKSLVTRWPSGRVDKAVIWKCPRQLPSGKTSRCNVRRVGGRRYRRRRRESRWRGRPSLPARRARRRGPPSTSSGSSVCGSNAFDEADGTSPACGAGGRTRRASLSTTMVAMGARRDVTSIRSPAPSPSPPPPRTWRRGRTAVLIRPRTGPVPGHGASSDGGFEQQPRLVSGGLVVPEQVGQQILRSDRTDGSSHGCGAARGLRRCRRARPRCPSWTVRADKQCRPSGLWSWSARGRHTEQLAVPLGQDLFEARCRRRWH